MVWTVQYGWRREATPIRKVSRLPLGHVPERWFRFPSWVSVQKLRTAPGAGLGAAPSPPASAVFCPSGTLEWLGVFSQKGQVGWGVGREQEVLKPLALPSRSSSPGTGPAGQQGGNVQPRADCAAQARTEEACLGLHGRAGKREAGLRCTCS